MELWRELLISGLENETYTFNSISDTVLKEIIKNQAYKVLLEIKQTIEDENFTDLDCFMKIEEILSTLEKNNIYCYRHDFG